MRVQLICKDKNRKIIEMLLSAEKLEITDNGPVAIVEKGMPVPENIGVIINFHMESLSELIGFLQNIGVEDHFNHMIMGKSKEAFIPISLENVVYFNGLENKTFCNTKEGQKYLIKYKLYQLEELLPGYFIRINKSEIMNIKMIDRIVPMFKGKLILYVSGYKTPFDISRNYSKAFKERLGV